MRRAIVYTKIPCEDQITRGQIASDAMSFSECRSVEFECSMGRTVIIGNCPSKVEAGKFVYQVLKLAGLDGGRKHRFRRAKDRP